MAISWIWKFLHVFSTIIWSALTSGCWLRFLCCWSWSCGSNEPVTTSGCRSFTHWVFRIIRFSCCQNFIYFPEKGISTAITVSSFKVICFQRPSKNQQDQESWHT